MRRIRYPIALLFALSPFVLPVVAQIVEEARLRAPSARAEGEPLFERLSPERTHIHFENRFDHPRRWLELWRQYFNGSIGTGVVLGDVNGDDLPDIFLVGKDSPNALYLNRGDFVFEDATQTAGVAGGPGIGAGASFADVDGDGDLDLYVCFVGSSNELYINDGTGAFVERAEDWGVALVTGSNAPSFADYDRDGDLDLYLQRNFLHGKNLLDGMSDLLFENAGGGFVDVTEAAGIEGEGQGHVAIWWDFNDDSWPDIYVSNDFAPVDKLYRNNRDGTFTDVIGKTLMGVPYSAMGADFGDLNNDGHMDFIAAEMAPRSREYYHQALGPLSGKLLGLRNAGVNQYMQNQLAASIGPGRFAEFSHLAGLHATDWTWASRFADLDNDGLLDAFFANGMARAFHDADIAGRVGKARNLKTRVLIYEKSPPLRERNLAFRNLGAFAFEEVGAKWGIDDKGVSFAAAFADFDQDGDLDLVVSNWKENASVYRNNSLGGHRITIRLEGVESNRFGVGARVSLEVDGEVQTREISLMRGYMSVDQPILHFASQDSAIADTLRIEWPSGATQVFSDVDLDRHYRIREMGTENGHEKWEAAAPLFKRSSIELPADVWSEEEVYQLYKGQLLLPFAEDRMGPELVAADLNGDGWEDLILGGATGEALRVFLNQEGKSFESVESRDFASDYLAEDSGILPFDFDGDQDLDLFVTSGGIELDLSDEYYADRLYLNRGDGTFARLENGSLARANRSSGRAVVVSDSRDETLLLVAGGPVARAYPKRESSRAWRVAKSDTFLSQGKLPVGLAESLTTDFAVADLDGDDSVEVVQLVAFGAPQIWSEQDGVWSELAVIEGASRLRGMWRSLAIADFDKDGRLDIALGNLGLNTKYRVSEESPGVLLASDEPALAGKFIEAETRDGKLYPRESRIFHQVDFPEITSRTGSYADFSKMTVQEAFSQEALSGFERYDFNETRSIILFQDASGVFRAKPLPHLAQAGAAISLLAADVDTDGDEDLFAVNEALSPQPFAANYPATSFITVLLNDGRGEFEALLPWESGLHLEEGQPRRLVWTDLDDDGQSELIVSVSEGPLSIFERDD